MDDVDVVGDTSPMFCEKTLSASRLVEGRPVETLRTPVGRDGLMLDPDRDLPAMCPSMAESTPSSSSSMTASTNGTSAAVDVILPWLMVRLVLWRLKGRRLRRMKPVKLMSSCEMTASGDRSASGCGRVVLETPLKGSGNPVSCLGNLCRLDEVDSLGLRGSEAMLIDRCVVQRCSRGGWCMVQV